MRTIAREIGYNRLEGSDLEKQAMARKKTLLVIPAEAIAGGNQAIGIELEPKTS